MHHVNKHKMKTRLQGIAWIVLSVLKTQNWITAQ
jgi:hypothetical protein